MFARRMTLTLDHGVLQVSAGLDNKRVKEGVTLFLRNLSDLKTENISDIELNKVKQLLQGQSLSGT